MNMLSDDTSIYVPVFNQQHDSKFSRSGTDGRSWCTETMARLQAENLESLSSELGVKNLCTTDSFDKISKKILFSYVRGKFPHNLPAAKFEILSTMSIKCMFLINNYSTDRSQEHRLNSPPRAQSNFSTFNRQDVDNKNGMQKKKHFKTINKTITKFVVLILVENKTNGAKSRAGRSTKHSPKDS